MIEDSRPTAVVVGSTFGRFYSRALSRPDAPARLIAIAGTGSQESQTLAEQLGVAYVTDATEVGADIAVVAVRSTVVGGKGDEIARSLLESGSHVLQEHPVHPHTMAELLRFGVKHGRTYSTTGFYEHLPSFREFVAVLRVLTQDQSPEHIFVRTCGQILQSTLGLVAACTEGLPIGECQVTGVAGEGRVLVSGAWAGVPVNILVNNHRCPADPDNHSQPLFAAIVDLPDGELHFSSIHGPIAFHPRPHVVNWELTNSGSGIVAVGREDAPASREIFDDIWISGVHHAVATLVRRIRNGELGVSQRELGVMSLWSTVTPLIGPLKIVDSHAPSPIDVEHVSKLAREQMNN